jgi:hypothetical protein
VVNATDNVVNATDNVVNSTDNVANATDNAVNSTDNVANSTDNVANTTDNVANSTDNVANTTDNANPTRLESGPGGAQYVDTPDSAAARQFYEKIAAMVDEADVAAISQNTGIPQNIIQRVKDHVFRTVHDLEVGNYSAQTTSRVQGQFAPLDDIARMWKNAMENNLTGEQMADKLAEFRKFIAHEYVESNLMREGHPYLNPNSWQEHPIYGWGNYPTPGNPGVGAHNMSPSPGHGYPFNHWPGEQGFAYDGTPLLDDLSNIDQVIQDILAIIKTKK